MTKRLLAAATAIALCALAMPADARRSERDWDGDLSPRAYEHERGWDRSWHRDDGEDDEANTDRRRHHRAARQRTRDQAAGKSKPPQAAKPSPIAAAPPAPAQTPDQGQQLAAANLAPETPKLEQRALVPPEAAKPPGELKARNDGRGCLKPGARALLERIEAQFGPVQIISTCRPGARIAGSGRISKHATGEAIDFNAGRRKAEVVRWLIANHRSGGTMTYANMSHIHVDVGQRFVSLNAGSGR